MIGNYKNKLDEKGRITIPSKFRDELGAEIVISYGFDNTLELRTAKAFKEWIDTLSAKGNLNKNARQLSRLILGNSFDLTVDKSGRINVPNDLLEKANILKEVSLVGIGDKIEIHASEQWDSINNDADNLAASMEELAEALSGE